MPGILVGVDGSEHSRQALAWAMHEAAQRHVPLTVLAVRPRAVRPATEIFWNIPKLEDEEREYDLDQARAAVQDWVDKVASETGTAVADVQVDVIHGDPAEELVRASRDADLIVVGSRGAGGFTKLLLGSVSSKITHRAACPAVVVPHR